MLRRVLFAAASVVALTAAANAADLYRAAPEAGGYKDTSYAGVNWTGLYFGANGGYAWGQKIDGIQAEGGFGGGQIGLNYQGLSGISPNVVVGIETDIQGGDINDTKGGDKLKTDWFGSVRGRLGYTIDKALIYGTGGFAYGNVKYSTPRWSEDKTETGWVAGGGIEYKINPSWSLKAEYQYLSLDLDHAFKDEGLNKSRYEVNTFRVGVNYFVDKQYVPLK